jgi:surface protein
MRGMFQGAGSFNQKLNDWDVSNVTDMSAMFAGNLNWHSSSDYSYPFDQDLNSWDVSKVTNMQSMFEGAKKFNSGINKWNTSNVTDMVSMFEGTEEFNQDIGEWDVSKVEVLFRMFTGSKKFNQDLSGWCVSNISQQPVSFIGEALESRYIPIWGTCPSESTIWNGTTITFTKADGANPEEEANQDRITDNIWITRGNDGGQIYNIAKEDSPNQTNSPVGTKWAVGTLDEIETLTFKKFRAAVEKPNSSLVGKNLVMYLEEDDIYLSIKFTSWSEQKNGGFAYERSTKP